MSAASVRAAIAAWISNGQLPGVNMVYRAQPWYIDGDLWQLDANLGSGAVAYVHISEESEARLTLPALGGDKAITYTCGLVVLYQFLIPSGTITAVSEDTWVDPLDTTLEAVKARLRADPTLGTAGNPIFEAAQDPADCKITRDLPVIQTGGIYSWNVVEFHATEIVVA